MHKPSELERVLIWCNTLGVHAHIDQDITAPAVPVTFVNIHQPRHHHFPRDVAIFINWGHRKPFALTVHDAGPPQLSPFSR